MSDEEIIRDAESLVAGVRLRQLQELVDDENTSEETPLAISRELDMMFEADRGASSNGPENTAKASSLLNTLAGTLFG